MLAVKSVNVRDNFKEWCDKISMGETVVISRPRNENIYMINEAEYNALQKAKQSETLNILLRLMKAWHSLNVGKLYRLRWKNYKQWKPRTGSPQKRYWNLRKSMEYKGKVKVNGRFYIYRKGNGTLYLLANTG